MTMPDDLTHATIPGLPWVPSFWGARDLRFARPFVKPPDLLIMHSGASANWVAEYLSNPVCTAAHIVNIYDKAPDGCRLVDGVWYRVAAAHVCWYDCRAGKLYPSIKPPERAGFVNTARLDYSVPGATGYNDRAIHVELPAARVVRDEFAQVIWGLQLCVPTLRFWARHSDLQESKRDPVPGSGFSEDWLDGSGLVRLR